MRLEHLPSIVPSSHGSNGGTQDECSKKANRCRVVKFLAYKPHSFKFPGVGVEFELLGNEEEDVVVDHLDEVALSIAIQRELHCW